MRLRKVGLRCAVAGVVLLTGLALPFGVSGSPVAAVTCEYRELGPAGPVGNRLVVTSVRPRQGLARLGRSGDSLTVTPLSQRASGGFAPSGAPLTCSGGSPTVDNLDSVRMPRFGFVEIDLGGGLIGPGARAEADGSPEIELFASVEGFGIRGGAGVDLIEIGETGPDVETVNLNAGEAGADVDLEIEGRRQPMLVLGLGGADRLSAAGTGTGDRPAGAAISLTGGPGPDTLTAGVLGDLYGGPAADVMRGGARADTFVGGEGADLMSGAAGRDSFSAKDGTRDTVRCGAGSDIARVDARDRLFACERVRS